MGNSQEPHINPNVRPQNVAATTLDEATFRSVFPDADALLRRHIDILNAINVYPVPDGDTGTNMSLTLRAAVEGMHAEPKGTGIEAAAKALARGALMGARGNSGVILSQILRGLADGLVGEPVDGLGLAAALESAKGAAYRALSDPKEGTILTAIREAATAAAQDSKADAAETLATAARAARDAVDKTPDLLPVLKEAGVVDAGAFGLAIIFEGLRRSLAGKSMDFELARPVDISRPMLAGAAALHRGEHGDSGYCTEFLLAGTNLDATVVRSRLEPMGSSLLVVGEPDLLRVHVHTSRPDDVLSYGRSIGEITQTKVDNLEAQIDSFTGAAAGSPNAPSAVSVVAVASGPGIEQVLRSIGVDILIEGGQTMNPSTGEILEAIESAPSESVVVLPNNRNIVAAAEQAASQSSKDVIVVGSRSIPQGIAAAIALNPDSSLEENKQLMERSLSSVCSGEVTRAVRATSLDGKQVHVGDAIGIVDGDLCVVANSVGEAVRQTVERMSHDDASLLTLYSGHDIADADAEQLAASLRDEYTTLEVELIRGGQPHYLYLISLE